MSEFGQRNFARGRKHLDGTLDDLSVGYHPRVEDSDRHSFLTTRSRNSELWFVNNRPLEKAVLGYAAKYSQKYGSKLYGLAIEGNHIQGVAAFPHLNRAAFMRDFKSCVARAVPRYTTFPGGTFFGRRYSEEQLPSPEDLEEYFFYTVLQPVQDGLVERISDYNGYNCFHDAVWGIERQFEVMNWKNFNKARKRNPRVPSSRFITIVTLKYDRIPGYEQLSTREYALMMSKKLEERRQRIVEERRAKGLGFMGPEKLKKVKPGSIPRNTKTSTITSHRPRVLCVCPVRRAHHLGIYFDTYWAYKDASKRYRAGDLSVVFPPGTYKPALSPPAYIADPTL